MEIILNRYGGHIMKAEKQICLSVPEELLKQIKQASEEDFMSMNSFIRAAIVKYLRERDKNDSK